MLAATFKYHDEKEFKRAAKLCNLVELRLDLFKPKSFFFSIPVIFKMNTFDEKYLKYVPNFVDLPFQEAILHFPYLRKKYPHLKLIASFHDYEKTPDLESIFEEMKKSGADFYKLATYAESTNDALRMLLFVKKHRCIGICMGKKGEITRILAPLFGAPWTYAPSHLSHQTAEGQILLDDLLHIYRYSSLSETTSLYGLIGNPTAQSPSHKTHNFAFQKLKVDAVYVKMSVKKEELALFFSLANELKIKGLSVTMPLKKEIAFYMGLKCDAVNTLKWEQNQISGLNTDGVGALNAIERKIKVEGKKICILGAGATAKAIAHEAEKRGAIVKIYNRRRIERKDYDILINCTPLGMKKEDPLPLLEEDILEKKVVLDAVISPRLTAFLKACKKKRCIIIEGMDFFIEQAKQQFYFWLIT